MYSDSVFSIRILNPREMCVDGRDVCILCILYILCILNPRDVCIQIPGVYAALFDAKQAICRGNACGRARCLSTETQVCAELLVLPLACVRDVSPQKCRLRRATSVALSLRFTEVATREGTNLYIPRDNRSPCDVISESHNMRCQTALHQHSTTQLDTCTQLGTAS